MSETRVIPTVGRNNCGGRCLLFAHVRDGEIRRFTTETVSPVPGQPPLTACARGLQYHRTFLRPDRLTKPLLRVGARGEGRFVPISWAEALDRLAEQWGRIRDRYGPGSRYVHYSTGVSAAFRPDKLCKRLLALDGGYLDYYNDYSCPCISAASRLMYGTEETGSSPETWLQSRLILLWGHNPAATHFDASTMYFLRRAKERGVPIVVVDPRESETVRALGAEWVPLRPATDAALLDAMAWVIWTEGLADREFLDHRCLGFDGDHMPAGADPRDSVLDYLLGTKDGTPKTPDWAETVTGVPAGTIRDLARRYALARPAALVQGYGAQRHAYGEQSARGAILLACMTGNVGVPGGGAAGVGFVPGHQRVRMPLPENPYGRSIPVFRWMDAVDHGHAMTARQGVVGGPGLCSDVKMIVSLAGNSLINQHSDINAAAALLRDERKCEFLLCSDLFLTPTARFADLLLPGVSFLECENLTNPWHWGDFVGFCNQIVQPVGEGRFEYEWLSELAGRLGLGPAFTLGRNHEDWLRAMYAETRAREPELPAYEALKAAGVYRYAPRPPFVAFAAEREGARPFPTESGLVELYSPAAARGEFEDPFPAIPCYVPPPEGPQDPLRARYPLQLIGWHSPVRCHSIHDNNPDLRRLEPQRLWLNPADAAARGLTDGEEALVFNDRGRLLSRVKVTERVRPGVAALAQGTWYRPDDAGTDQNASLNVLTGLRPTPLAHGNPQHTNLVQVEKA